MGNVKLNGETFPDRRTNGARIKLDVADWIKIMCTIAVLIFGAGKLMTTVSAQTKTIAEHAFKISTVERDIGIIKSDVSYIRGYIDKIK